ncbi:hypothetical protein SG34_006955 [Thalassomonas viridans]|uniref:Uncharacterized protein n=1 Tax=Thalassomonas viridans TaxID=137584 RepID=A0AAE9Z5V0_9GAMM|nr:hypothetical protein [Thalassomonas viridans]WDE06639.1 hypothetical protein SG34_006955 [Thalassomonas viridans]
MKLCRKIIICLVCAGLSSCAMVDPYEPLAKYYDDYSALPTDSITLPQAVGYARAVRMDYIKKIQAENRDLSELGIATMVLAGAIGADTIIDRSDDLITIGSILGVTGLSAAQWLSDGDRTKLYALGARALTCAVEAVVPLQSVQVADISNYKATLFTELIKVQTLYEQTILLQQSNLDSSLNLLIEKNLTDAKGQITAAQKTYKNGDILQRKVQSAGSNLQVTVDDINNKVLLGLIEGERDITSLREAIKGLVVQAGGFIEIPGQSLFTAIDAVVAEGEGYLSDKEKGQEAIHPENILRTLTQLKVALAGLNSAAFQLESVISGVTHNHSDEKLKSCGVDVVRPLSVSKSEIVFVKGVDFVETFTIAGGNKKYSIIHAIPGISVQQSEHFGARVTVKASGAELQPGSYFISVSDDKEQKQDVTVKVIEQPSQTQNQPTGKDKQFCEKPENKELDICNIQLSLQRFNLFEAPDKKNLDGKCGDNTLKGVRKLLLLMQPSEALPELKCENTVLEQLSNKINSNLPFLIPPEALNESGLLLLHARMLKEDKAVDKISQEPVGQAEVDYLNGQLAGTITAASPAADIRIMLEKLYFKRFKKYLHNKLNETSFKADTPWTDQDTQALDNSSFTDLKGKITAKSSLYALIEIAPVLFALQAPGGAR